MNANYLHLSWSVSRGIETYGYNICRLDDNATNKRYKCMGGGYDMVGTVIGQWLADQYQDRLRDLAVTYQERLQPYGSTNWKQIPGLYGITFRDDGRASLDGACGKESMIKIARAVGVDITSNYNRRKNRTDGFFVSDFGSEAELIKAGR